MELKGIPSPNTGGQAFRAIAISNGRRKDFLYSSMWKISPSTRFMGFFLWASICLCDVLF